MVLYRHHDDGEAWMDVSHGNIISYGQMSRLPCLTSAVGL